MNVFEATSTLLTRANYYAMRPSGKCFIISRSSYAIRADRPNNEHLRFQATDLLADDWEVLPIPTAEAPRTGESNAA
jgi:hypothetical protein